MIKVSFHLFIAKENITINTIADGDFSMECFAGCQTRTQMDFQFSLIISPKCLAGCQTRTQYL
jgi:hypothetical protein